MAAEEQVINTCFDSAAERRSEPKSSNRLQTVDIFEIQNMVGDDDATNWNHKINQPLK